MYIHLQSRKHKIVQNISLNHRLIRFRDQVLIIEVSINLLFLVTPSLLLGEVLSDSAESSSGGVESGCVAGNWVFRAVDRRYPSKRGMWSCAVFARDTEVLCVGRRGLTKRSVSWWRRVVSRGRRVVFRGRRVVPSLRERRDGGSAGGEG
jgi:hypothetical protein